MAGQHGSRADRWPDCWLREAQGRRRAMPPACVVEDTTAVGQRTPGAWAGALVRAAPTAKPCVFICHVGAGKARSLAAALRANRPTATSGPALVVSSGSASVRRPEAWRRQATWCRYPVVAGPGSRPGGGARQGQPKAPLHEGRQVAVLFLSLSTSPVDSLQRGTLLGRSRGNRIHW